MAIWSLTRERVEKLLKQIADKEGEIDDLIKQSPESMWRRDLEAILVEWRKTLDKERQTENKNKALNRRASQKFKEKRGGKKRKADDDSDFETKTKKAPAAKKVQPQPKANAFTHLKAKDDLGFDGSSDIDFAEIGKAEDDLADSPAGARGKRAKAAKPGKYALSDDSDSGDDMLGDVSKLVKGLGGGDSKPGARPLFSQTASRPGSSHGLLSKRKSEVPRIVDMSDNDETDFAKLIPQPSPKKPVKTSASDDEEEDSFAFTAAPPKTKAAPKAAAKPVTKAAAKPAAKTAAKKAAPAAKPAAKKAAAPKGGKTTKVPLKKGGDSEDDDIDDIANDILEDSEMPDADSSPVAPRARAPRRAAVVATKKAAKYVDSEEEESEQESVEEDDFDEDDD
jgi:DNA topoisomerase II